MHAEHGPAQAEIPPPCFTCTAFPWCFFIISLVFSSHGNDPLGAEQSWAARRRWELEDGECRHLLMAEHRCFRLRYKHHGGEKTKTGLMDLPLKLIPN